MDLILEILSYAFWVILAVTILVFVHEMGHFLFARLFGMRVDRFSIGFPPRIFAKRIGETEYVIGATPLGGYVKIAGMVDESMDVASLREEPKSWEFRSKPVWQRMIVISGGGGIQHAPGVRDLRGSEGDLWRRHHPGPEHRRGVRGRYVDRLRHGDAHRRSRPRRERRESGGL